MMGYGLSDKPADYAYSIIDQADIAQELVAELGVTSCDVLCQDVGDTVCQELLARQGDPVSGRHMAEHYLSIIPNPDVRILDEVGHFPQLEVPALILDEALRFFASSPE